MPNFNLTYQNDGENEQLYYKDAHNNDLYIRSCEDFAPAIIQEKSGNPITITDATSCPIRKLKVALEPIQEGSGDPSPDNVRPITGRDSVTVVRTGINVWDEEWELGGINVTTGENVANTGRLRSKNYIPVVGGEPYYFAFDNVYTSGTWFTVHRYGKNKEYLGNINPNKNTAATMPNGTYFIRFNTSDAWNGATYTGGISINYPSTDRDYHAYDGTSVTIQLGQTVYGATVDVTGGKVRVTWAKIRLDGTQQISVANWKPQANSVGWLYPYTMTRNVIGTGTVVQNVKCDTLPSKPFDTLQSINGAGIALASNMPYGIAVMYPDPSLTTIAAINAFLAEHPIDVVYELAEPFDIDLTPASLSTLNGENTFSTDGTSIELEYVVDTKTYIDNLVNGGAKTVVKTNDDIKIIDKNRGVE